MKFYLSFCYLILVWLYFVRKYNILCKFPLFWNLFRPALWPSHTGFLANVPCALAKNTYSAVVGCSVLQMSLRTNELSILFKSLCPFWFFLFTCSISCWERWALGIFAMIVDLSVFLFIYFWIYHFLLYIFWIYYLVHSFELVFVF